MACPRNKLPEERGFTSLSLADDINGRRDDLDSAVVTHVDILQQLLCTTLHEPTSGNGDPRTYVPRARIDKGTTIKRRGQKT